MLTRLHHTSTHKQNSVCFFALSFILSNSPQIKSYLNMKIKALQTLGFRIKQILFCKVNFVKNAISTKLWWIYWSRYQDLKYMVQDSIMISFSIIVFTMFRRVVFSRNHNDYSRFSFFVLFDELSSKKCYILCTSFKSLSTSRTPDILFSLV